jgi:hypothetical protein
LVDFDVETDRRFSASLQLLGVQGEVDVLAAIDDLLAQQLTWENFVEQHGWEPLQLHGQDTYPGAVDLFSFVLQGPSGQYYEIFASTVNHTVVVCAIARLFTPSP